METCGKCETKVRYLPYDPFRILVFSLKVAIQTFIIPRDVLMNLTSVNSGPEMAFVQNMHHLWFSIVENLAAHVE